MRAGASAYLALDPERVDQYAIEDRISRLNDEWTYSDTCAGTGHFVPWWSRTSRKGTDGKPARARAETGEALGEAVINLIRFCEHFRALEPPRVADRRPSRCAGIRSGAERRTP